MSVYPFFMKYDMVDNCNSYDIILLQMFRSMVL